MADIDARLAGLRELSVPPTLGLIDGLVLDQLDAKLAQTSAKAGGVYAFAAGLALLTGFVGAALPSASAQAAITLVSLGDAANLAPSALLVGAE